MAKKKSFFRRAWKWFWNLVLSIGLIQWIIAVLIAIPIWFVYLTSKIKITNYETFKKYRKKPAIFVFWHGRSMMLSPIIAVGGMRAYAVASKHHDGRIMAKLQRLFGLRPIYAVFPPCNFQVFPLYWQILHHLRGVAQTQVPQQHNLCAKKVLQPYIYPNYP